MGIQTQASIDIAAQIQQWGIYGRELYNLLGNDPRETGEEISGPQDPGGRAGAEWANKYAAIRTINTYISVLDKADLTPAEVSASQGFANTLKAWHLHMLAVRSGPHRHADRRRSADRRSAARRSSARSRPWRRRRH